MFSKLNFTKDRRRGKRQLLNTSIRLYTDSACLDAIGMTISEYGMRLFTVAVLPVNSQVEIEFLAPRSRERVRVVGTVRHRALYLYGIEFLPDSDQISQRWENRSGSTRTSLAR